MHHSFLVATVKMVPIYGSYSKIKNGVLLFLDHPVFTLQSSKGVGVARLQFKKRQSGQVKRPRHVSRGARCGRGGA